MISSRKTAETAARLGNINQVVDASAAFEQRITLRDTLTTSAVAEVAAWANTGTVSITTGGVATFTNTVTPAVVGDTFESGGVLYTVHREAPQALPCMAPGVEIPVVAVVDETLRRDRPLGHLVPAA